MKLAMPNPRDPRSTCYYEWAQIDGVLFIELLDCLGLSYYSLARSRANSKVSCLILLELLDVGLLVLQLLRHRLQASLLECASVLGLCFLHLGIA